MADLVLDDKEHIVFMFALRHGSALIEGLSHDEQSAVRRLVDRGILEYKPYGGSMAYQIASKTVRLDSAGGDDHAA